MEEVFPWTGMIQPVPVEHLDEVVTDLHVTPEMLIHPCFRESLQDETEVKKTKAAGPVHV